MPNRLQTLCSRAIRYHRLRRRRIGSPQLQFADGNRLLMTVGQTMGLALGAAAGLIFSQFISYPGPVLAMAGFAALGYAVASFYFPTTRWSTADLRELEIKDLVDADDHDFEAFGQALYLRGNPSRLRRQAQEKYAIARQLRQEYAELEKAEAVPDQPAAYGRDSSNDYPPADEARTQQARNHQPHPAATAARLQQLQDQELAAANELHDDLSHQWAQYEIDPGLAIEYPAMTDPREEPTSRFLKSLRLADRLREAGDGEDYFDAVTILQYDFALALHHAEAVGLERYSPRAKAQRRQAAKLWALAAAPSATVPERRLAFQQLSKTLATVPDISGATWATIKNLQITSNQAIH